MRMVGDDFDPNTFRSQLVTNNKRGTFFKYSTRYAVVYYLSWVSSLRVHEKQLTFRPESSASIGFIIIINSNTIRLNFGRKYCDNNNNIFCYIYTYFDRARSSKNINTKNICALLHYKYFNNNFFLF